MNEMGNILLVEDNPAAVKRIRQLIHKTDSGLNIAVCSEAGEAFSRAQAEVFDLFILDIQLTDYKGTGLAKQLRALPQYRYTPILFETALAGEELAAYRDVKCYGFLIKPYTETEFRTAFCEALGLSAKLAGPVSSRRIEIVQKQFVFEYDLREILYAEAFGKHLAIHTNRTEIEANEKEDTISGYTLCKLLDLLDSPAFIRCHKSYIVNQERIDRIDKTGRLIYLKGSGKPIPIGNKYQAEVWSRT